jgi:hypothetical protein
LTGKSKNEGVGDIAGNAASDGCQDAEWGKFRFIEGIFVERQKRYTSVAGDW